MRHEVDHPGLFPLPLDPGLDERLGKDAAFEQKLVVGLQSIDAAHNFANLSGKDNAVLFYTNRYADLPLVVKGAGAGADVTAAGVFADIIRAAKI